MGRLQGRRDLNSLRGFLQILGVGFADGEAVGVRAVVGVMGEEMGGVAGR